MSRNESLADFLLRIPVIFAIYFSAHFYGWKAGIAALVVATVSFICGQRAERRGGSK